MKNKFLKTKNLSQNFCILRQIFVSTFFVIYTLCSCVPLGIGPTGKEKSDIRSQKLQPNQQDDGHPHRCL